MGLLMTKSLREQVYEYLRDEINKHEILPGSTINLNELSKKLGISKTPLRDAIIQLEIKGFVTILPRRGVIVKKLTLQEVKDSYTIVGALESAVLLEVFDRIDESRISRMQKLNGLQVDALQKEEYDLYYRHNLDFHNVFLDLSDNQTLKNVIMPLKQRLYDFPRRGYIREWELNNCREHEQFIENIRKKDSRAAAGLLRDVHWSFKVQEQNIRKFYRNGNGFDPR